MIGLGLRLVVSGGREALTRLVVLAVAVGLGVGLLLTAVAIDVTWTLSGVCASCAGMCPMMMTSESGDGSPASPITPARRPG